MKTISLATATIVMSSAAAIAQVETCTVTFQYESATLSGTV